MTCESCHLSGLAEPAEPEGNFDLVTVREPAVPETVQERSTKQEPAAEAVVAAADVVVAHELADFAGPQKDPESDNHAADERNEEEARREPPSVEPLSATVAFDASPFSLASSA